MSELVDMLVRGGLLFAAASIGNLALRGRSPALVSCYWRTAVVAILLVPIVPTVWTWHQSVPEIPVKVVVELPSTAALPVVEVPTMPVEVVPVGTIFEPAAAVVVANELPPALVRAVPVAESPSFVWLGVLGLAIWGFGMLVIFGRWVIAALRFRLLWRRAVPAGDAQLVEQFRKIARELGLRRVPKLMTHSQIAVPMAGGLLRSRVLLPNDCATWEEADRSMVLMHELVHVKRRDALFHLLGSVAKALHWVNPLAWLAARSMRDAAERATDDRVLESGAAEGPSYARLLVEFACRQMASPSPVAPAAASSMAKPDTVESRVRRILDLRERRARPGALVSMLVAGGFAGLLLLVGGAVLAGGDEKPGATEEEKADAQAIASMSERLEKLVVARVEFEEASLDEVVGFCISRSREADPEGQGINIIVIGNTVDPVPQINLQLRDIPMGELLRYVAKLSGNKLDIEPHSVVFRPSFGIGGALISKTYPLSVEQFEKAAAMPGGGESVDDPFGGGGGGGSPSPSMTARNWLDGAGVGFPDGSSAHFEPLSSKLIVRNTERGLELVEEILDSMRGVKPVAPPRSDALEERLRSVIIPMLDFQDATLQEALDFLGTQTGDKPINLIHLGGGMTSSRDGALVRGTISLQLRDIPFGTALGYITESIGYSYRIERHAVVITPSFSESAELVVRTLPIRNAQLQERFGANPKAAKIWLAGVGVQFSEGTSAHFEPIGNNLILHVQTFAIGLVEDALANIPESSPTDASTAVAKLDPLEPEKLGTWDDARAASNVIVEFFAANTVKDRLHHVRDAQRVEPLMTAWYAENEAEIIFGDLRNIPISRELVKRIEDGGRSFVIVAMTIASIGPKVYALEQTGAGLKLDWETTVGYQPMPIARFKAEKPRKPVAFRVKVKPSDFYNYGFSDDTKYRAVKLSYPGRLEFNLTGYIPRGTEWGAKLIERLDAGEAPSLIVSLKYPEGEIKDDAQVEIDSIISETWWP